MTTSKWNWDVDPLSHKDKCPGCTKGLFGGGDIVSWNGGRWHIGCLLDKLTAEHNFAKPYTSINPADNWGYSP